MTKISKKQSAPLHLKKPTAPSAVAKPMTPSVVKKPGTLKGSAAANPAAKPAASNGAAAPSVAKPNTAPASTNAAADTKRVVVIDSFDKKSVDVNGDGKADVSHGEFVSRLVEQTGAAKGKKFEAVRVQMDQKNGGTDFEATFNKMTARIKSGEKIDGINLSQTLSCPLFDANGKQTGSGSPSPENIAKGAYPKDASKQAEFIKAGHSPAGYSAAQKSDAKAFFEKNFNSSLPAYKNMLAAAQAKNIPVTVSAGNEPGHLNPFTLYEPSIAVGSSNGRAANGKSSFTSGVSPTDTYAPGDLNSRKVAGGIDVTGDGKADFKTSELSHGRPALAGVLGKSYDSVKASPADYQAVAEYFSQKQNVKGGAGPKVEGKVFDIKQLGDAMNAAAAKTGQGIVDKSELLGTRFQQQFTATGGKVAFVADENLGINARSVAVEKGKVVVDANGTGGKDVIHNTQGTSWSAPIALAQEVLKRTA